MDGSAQHGQRSEAGDLNAGNAYYTFKYSSNGQRTMTEGFMSDSNHSQPPLASLVLINLKVSIVVY